MTKNVLTKGASAHGSDRGVTVLLVSEADHDYEALRDIFSHSNWTLARVPSVKEAEHVLETQTIPVVIVGGAGDSDSWDSLRKTLLLLPNPPKVVASVRFSEANRWMDLIDSGVFDVLPRPYDPAEVFQVIGFAWLEWRRATALSPIRAAESSAATAQVAAH